MLTKPEIKAVENLTQTEKEKKVEIISSPKVEMKMTEPTMPKEKSEVDILTYSLSEIKVENPSSYEIKIKMTEQIIPE